MGERPWIEHDGSGCPVPKGTLVDIQQDRGGMIEAIYSVHALSCGDGLGRSWHWAPGFCRTVAYRLSKPDDSAIRTARMEQFRKMAQPNPADVRTPVKTPEKVRG